MQVLPTGPDQDVAVLGQVVFSAVAGARTVIRIATPYFVPDAGLRMALTRGLANEWAKFGIRTNAIAPGFIPTDINRKMIEKCKRGTYIINTARGEVIDEAALARMLEKGELAGAGLDVFEHEPAINPKLKKLTNVVLLPHMASATIESRIEMGERVIINIKMFADGHKPPDRIILGLE